MDFTMYTLMCIVHVYSGQRTIFRVQKQFSVDNTQGLDLMHIRFFIQCLKALYVTNIIGFQFQLLKVNGFSDKI